MAETEVTEVEASESESEPSELTDDPTLKVLMPAMTTTSNSVTLLLSTRLYWVFINVTVQHLHLLN